MNPFIVVGYDGSEHADAAVDWAAAEADRRGALLRVMHVTDYGLVPVPLGFAPGRADLVHAAAERVVAQGVDRARTAAPGLAVEGAWNTSSVPYQLIRASAEAALLVVGSHGHGEAVAALLGSVAFTVTAHAHCPVVVVRGKDLRPAGPGRAVVTGFDGSQCSQAAVRFAADRAAQSGAPLTVVAAHPFVDRQSWSTIGSWAVETDVMNAYAAELRRGAGIMADQAADLALAAHPGLQVERRVAEGRPADVIADVAHGAGLAVVGSRGRGTFAGLVLGSDSHRLIHLAPCPVAVVR